MNNLKFIYPALLLFIYTISSCSGQKNSDVFTILSYNVENLFDTINDPNTKDDEFTPQGKKKWTSDRYYRKIDSLNKVIRSINKDELPEIIGFCEVENKQVVEELIKRLNSKKKYAIIHKESPDRRGIDVALLYRQDEFKVINSDFIKIQFSFEPKVTTRDILYVKGIASGIDTIHIFLNHWSSRRGGMKFSERKRVHAAKILRLKIDSIQKAKPNAKIICLGDFNDEPTNISLTGYLKANNKRLNAKNYELYNLMYDMSNIQREGSYSFKGKWDMIDNLIISQSLLKQNKGYYATFDSGKIFDKDFVLYYNTKIDQKTPSKTYGGNNYYGGFSDHLPVYFQLIKNE